MRRLVEMARFSGGWAFAFVALLSLAVLLPLASANQIPFAVYGTVRGPDGSPVASAQVVITNGRTNETITLSTDADGQYSTDINQFPSGYMAGDSLALTASALGKTGSNATTVDMSRPNARCDIRLLPMLVEIYHQAVTEAQPGMDVEIGATILSGNGTVSATLFYRQPGWTDFKALGMYEQSSGLWVNYIPGEDVRGSELEYYVTATDGSSHATWPALPPQKVAVTQTTGPQITHTPVTTGTAGSPLTISATASAPAGFWRVHVAYHTPGDTQDKELDMTYTGDGWSAVIDAANVTSLGVEYAIVVEDISFETVRHPPVGYHYVSISDSTPPVIMHTPLGAAERDSAIYVYAKVTDDRMVMSATMHYRNSSDASYASVEMRPISGGLWVGVVPYHAVKGSSMDYYITASDGANTAEHGSAELPHKIALVPEETGMDGTTQNEVEPTGRTSPLHGTVLISIILVSVLAALHFKGGWRGGKALVLAFIILLPIAIPLCAPPASAAGTPYAIWGFVRDGGGDDKIGVWVTVKNNRTGESAPDKTNSIAKYLVDLNSLPSGYVNGDWITVNCTYQGLNYVNWCRVDTSKPNMQCDIIVVEIEPPANLTLEVENGDVKLNWTAPSGTTVDVYEIFRAGSPGAFNYSDPLANTTYTNWTDAGAAVDQQSRFYVVRTVAVGGGREENEHAVGRHALTVTPGWNLVSFPFDFDNNTLEAVLGDQLTGGELGTQSDKLLAWNATAQGWMTAYLYESINFPQFNGTWVFESEEFGIEPSCAYWLWVRDDLMHPAVTLNITGTVGGERNASFVTGWNFYGHSSYTSVSLENGAVDSSGLYAAGFTGAEFPSGSDRILGLSDGSWTEQYMYCSVNFPAFNGTWTGENLTLEAGKGYWVQVRGGRPGFEWTY